MRRRKPGLVAVALCLGGALTACGGGGDGEGYAAVGAGPSPGGAGTPSGAVTLVPLDGPTTRGDTSSTSSPSPEPEPDPSAVPPPTGGDTAPPGTPGSSGADASTGSSAGTDTGTGSSAAPTTAPGGSGGTPPGPDAGAPPRTPSAPPSEPAPGTGTPAPTTPTPVPTPEPTPGPAVVTVSAPVLADGDRRWCEKVTVTFSNSGGTAARSGTVTFATHVIGALGVDWATLTSTQPLPAPIAAGTARTETYTVCVDSWRVPLGMRIDTRKVSASWQ
ncbi:hypothetical protein OG259_20545 [Streptomyces sp. NBC_00250]|uniref:hypothetical protein n=1 Tax=Streptomyces sp. NBC_00250 TaxID=2903641 RepID=UPI002E283BE8|nr:hypothetical protein [Streptomyces sp. NBC_00250]